MHPARSGCLWRVSTRLRFRWDATKARQNRAKHGVAFQEATTVFMDSLASILDDQALPGREATVGESLAGRVLYVVFVETEHGVRILRARRATRKERKHHEEGA